MPPCFFAGTFMEMTNYTYIYIYICIHHQLNFIIFFLSLFSIKSHIPILPQYNLYYLCLSLSEVCLYAYIHAGLVWLYSQMVWLIFFFWSPLLLCSSSSASSLFYLIGGLHKVIQLGFWSRGEIYRPH